MHVKLPSANKLEEEEEEEEVLECTQERFKNGLRHNTKQSGEDGNQWI